MHGHATPTTGPARCQGHPDQLPTRWRRDGLRHNSYALLSDGLHNLGDVLDLGLAWAARGLAGACPPSAIPNGWRRATCSRRWRMRCCWSGSPGRSPGRPSAASPSRRRSRPDGDGGGGIGIAVNLGAAWLVRRRPPPRPQPAWRVPAPGGGRGRSRWPRCSPAPASGLGWDWLDPTTALLVAVVVAARRLGLLRDAFDAAMDAVPRGIDQAAVRDRLLAQPGVAAGAPPQHLVAGRRRGR